MSKIISRSSFDNPFFVILAASILFHLLLFILPYSVSRTEDETITLELVFDVPEVITPVEKNVVSAAPQAAPPAPAPKPKPAQPSQSQPVRAKPKLDLNDLLGNPSAKSQSLSKPKISTTDQVNDGIPVPNIQAGSSAESVSQRSAKDLTGGNPDDSLNSPNLANTESVNNAKILGKTAGNTSAAGSAKSSGFSNISQVTGLNGRKITFRPTPPALKIQSTNPVRFLITILPSGDVSKVVPYEKGNPLLEQEGIKYIRRFRFEPVFSDVVQQGLIELRVERGKILNQ